MSSTFSEDSLRALKVSIPNLPSTPCLLTPKSPSNISVSFPLKYVESNSSLRAIKACCSFFVCAAFNGLKSSLQKVKNQKQIIEEEKENSMLSEKNIKSEE